MTQNGNRQIYVNLPVSDLERSTAFFRTLGFDFNQMFTDEKAACMVLNGDAYVMLLEEPFFKTFTRNEICDTSRSTEALFAISCESRAAVDEMVQKAVASGGRHALDAKDYGFMYGWSFYDPDGHHWEVLWMDPSKGA
jgi:hypothetical protein